MRCPLVDQTAVGAPHGVMKRRVRWSRPDPINVVRTRGRFRARRSPRPRKTDCAEGRSRFLYLLYTAHIVGKIGASPTDRPHAAHSAEKNESETSDRPTLRRAQRGDLLSRKRPTDRPTFWPI